VKKSSVVAWDLRFVIKLGIQIIVGDLFQTLQWFVS